MSSCTFSLARHLLRRGEGTSSSCWNSAFRHCNDAYSMKVFDVRMMHKTYFATGQREVYLQTNHWKAAILSPQRSHRSPPPPTHPAGGVLQKIVAEQIAPGRQGRALRQALLLSHQWSVLIESIRCFEQNKQLQTRMRRLLCQWQCRSRHKARATAANVTVTTNNSIRAHGSRSQRLEELKAPQRTECQTQTP